jgi:hypothetical protein
MSHATRVRRSLLHLGHLAVIVGVAGLWAMVIYLVFPGDGVGPTQSVAEAGERAPGVNMGLALLSLASLIFAGLAGLIVEVVLLKSYVLKARKNGPAGLVRHAGYVAGLLGAPLLWIALYWFQRRLTELSIVEATHRGSASLTMELMALLTMLSATTLAVVIETGALKSYARALRGDG